MKLRHSNHQQGSNIPTQPSVPRMPTAVISATRENRKIIVSRAVFFSLIESFIFGIIRGTDTPEGFCGTIPNSFRNGIWNCARIVSGDGGHREPYNKRCESDEIALEYQDETISYLNNHGYSFRIYPKGGNK